MAVVRRFANVWATIQSVVSGLFSVLLPLAVLVLLTGNVLLLWVALFRDIDPLLSDRVVSVEPGDRYLDRNRMREYKITRELCSSRQQQVELVRAWTEARVGDTARPVVVFTSLFFDLKQGCHYSEVVQAVPETLPPAHYIYDVSLRSCNALNQCVNRHLEPIPFTVVGGMWRDMDPGMPPPLRLPTPVAPVPGPSRGFFPK